jgi:diguanylate cyclase (GGDEF)-like protein
VSAADLLLAHTRPHNSRRLSRRELYVEGALAAAVLAASVAVAALLPTARPWTLAAAAACAAAYALAGRVPLYVGGGCALPTQLVLVPMLLLLPLPAVPLVVVAGCLLAAGVDVAGGRDHPDRLLTATGDAGYVLAPVAVLALAGEPSPGDGWTALGAAFVAQCLLDAGLSLGREWLGRRIRPAAQLSVMATVYGVDALVLPVAMAVATHASGPAAAAAGTLPLILLLAAIGRDRNRHLGAALERLDELTDAQERVRVATRQATHDELTGLINHRGFQEALEREARRSRRGGAPMSLVLVDIDNFKRVNDTYGHQCGDEVLRAVGAFMGMRCRATDVTARYGGEELAVVLPDTDAEGALVIAEELRQAIGALGFRTSAGMLEVTASFGVAELTPDIADRHALVAAADAALYAAKHSGKNRTVVHRAPAPHPAEG